MTNPSYFERFSNIVFTRDDAGILTVRLHSDGEAFRFSAAARTQIMEAAHAIAADRDNRVMILTGTGDSWCEGFDRRPEVSFPATMPLAERWSIQLWEGRRLLQSLLDIDMPVIAAVNGPALVHSEYLLTCDIILAAEHACFQDKPHLDNGVSPTDGVHVLWPHVLGPIRGRYFLLTQQRIEAAEALALGVCNEVLPADRLLARAQDIAVALARQPAMTLRAARIGLTQSLKRLVAADLTLGLAVESLSALSKA